MRTGLFGIEALGHEPNRVGPRRVRWTRATALIHREPDKARAEADRKRQKPPKASTR
jgi:hypothetical protein